MTKKILKGKVVSDKNNKTIVVEVTRKFRHPFYGKIIKRSKKYHAHDEKNKFKTGQNVSIIECKPISKKSQWEEGRPSPWRSLPKTDGRRAPPLEHMTNRLIGMAIVTTTRGIASLKRTDLPRLCDLSHSGYRDETFR